MNKESIQKNRLAVYGVVVILIVGALFWFANDRGEPSVPVDDGQKENVVVSTTTLALIKSNQQILATLAQDSPFESSTAGWQTYVDEESGFSIRYPADLVQLTEQDHRGAGFFKGIFLKRSIPFETYDACDLRGVGEGGGGMLTEIPDFEMGINFSRKSLKDTIVNDKRDGANLKLWESDFLPDGTVIENSRDHPDSALYRDTKGSFEGYGFYNSWEGCGSFLFFAPLSPSVTLLLEYPFPLDSLSPIGGNPEGEKKFKKVQSQYPPIDRERLSNQILSTFRLLDK